MLLEICELVLSEQHAAVSGAWCDLVAAVTIPEATARGPRYKSTGQYWSAQQPRAHSNAHESRHGAYGASRTDAICLPIPTKQRWTKALLAPRWR
jgi:hypothetical protein